MGPTPLQNQLQSLSRLAFIASFALVSAVACGGFKSAPLDGGERVLPNSAGTVTEPSIVAAKASFIGGAEGGVRDNTYWVKVRVQGLTEQLNLEAFPSAGTQESSSDQQTVGAIDYWIQTACRDNACNQIAVHLTMQNWETNQTYREAILASREGQVVRRLPNVAFESLQQAMPELTR